MVVAVVVVVVVSAMLPEETCRSMSPSDSASSSALINDLRPHTAPSRSRKASTDDRYGICIQPRALFCIHSDTGSSNKMLFPHPIFSVPLCRSLRFTCACYSMRSV